jgi:hypothetical protein
MHPSKRRTAECSNEGSILIGELKFLILLTPLNAARHLLSPLCESVPDIIPTYLDSLCSSTTASAKGPSPPPCLFIQN